MLTWSGCARARESPRIPQHREKLAQEHRVLQLLDRYYERARQLQAIYDDVKGSVVAWPRGAAIPDDDVRA